MLKNSVKFCVAALILVLAVSGLAYSHEVQQRSAFAGTADARVSAEVQKMLADHPSFGDVRVSVEDSIVTLQGTVGSFQNKVRLHDIVKGLKGVEGVRNQVQVNTPAIADDQLLETLARKLRYDRVDQGNVYNNLTLDVHDGRVIIGGNVRTDVDRDSALAIVANAKGVTDMVDQIQVAPVSIFDDELRFRLARAIYGSPTLQRYALDPQAPIRIVVENGHATLYGVVQNRMDRQIADLRARSVPGLFSVDDRIVVANSEAALNR
jgi:osmotically-inducible protein OsmY